MKEKHRLVLCYELFYRVKKTYQIDTLIIIIN